LWVYSRCQLASFWSACGLSIELFVGGWRCATGGRWVYEAVTVVFGRGTASDICHGLRAERCFVFTSSQWHRCYPSCRCCRHSAPDNEPLARATEFNRAAVDYDVGVHSVRHVEAGYRSCNAGLEAAS